MIVQMLDYTGKGADYPDAAAARLLISAKNTRLLGNLSVMDFIHSGNEPLDLEEEEILEYISNTIPSSWEFVHYTFLIKNVSRAFTHQLVRTRTASFAQQSMRVTDMSDFEFIYPKIMGEHQETALHYILGEIGETYYRQLESGMSIEDARGILPTNISTNIMVNMSLRTVVETVKKRSNIRVQGEYREFVETLKERVYEVHPWTDKFFKEDVYHINSIQSKLDALKVSKEDQIEIQKHIDKLRGF